MMRKVIRAGTMGVAIVLVTAATAWADKPAKSPNPPFGPPATLPAGFVCPFALTVEELVNDSKTITHFDKQGGIRWEHGSGKIMWRYSGNGKSVELNISGPGKVTEGGDGLVHIDGTGPWALLFFPGDSPSSTALLIKGHLHLTFDPSTGKLTLVSYTGTAESICDMLS